MRQNFKIGKCYKINRLSILLFSNHKWESIYKDEEFNFILLGFGCIVKGNINLIKILHGSKICYLHPSWISCIIEL